MLKRWIVYLASLFAGLILIGAVLAALVWTLISARLPSLDVLTDYQPKLPLRVMSEDGVLLAEFGEERRRVVKLDDVPQTLRYAILAAEDSNFYDHSGVDWLAVLRAAYTNATTGSKQGAGTITMQVARNFFLTREQTLLRKANEVVLTFKIEKELTKDQILELYINQIYLGQRAYGFAAAANAYYRKPLDKLTPAEAAMLAGLPKAPSAYNPFANPNRARQRQQYVLRRMNELGYLDETAYKAAIDAPSTLRGSGSQMVHAEFVAEMARQFVFDLVGETAYIRGLTVTTTIKAADQEAAYQSLRQGVLEYERRQAFQGPEAYVELPAVNNPDPEALNEAVDSAFQRYPDSGELLTAVVLEANAKQVVITRGAGDTQTLQGDAIRFVRNAISESTPSGSRLRRGAVLRVVAEKDSYRITQMPQVEAALVAIDPKDGAVRSLVGGFDFNKNQYNHVTQASRQPGSAFKPFIFSAALEKGITPATVVNDAPLYFPGSQTGGEAWEPKNYDGKFEGPMRVRTALAKSKNLPSIRILRSIGTSYAQDYVSRFGFDPKNTPPYLTMALGASQATPMQMATAYATFANGGYHVKPYFIKSIVDARGQTIFEETPTVAGVDAEQVIDPRNAFIMTTMLRDVVRGGTATRARSLGRNDLAGKTGTTNDSFDAWFAGYNSRLVGIAWVGYDQPRSLGSRETGGGVALPIWINYMRTALKGVPEDELKPPTGVVSATLNNDPDSGLTDGGRSDWFYNEFPPKVFMDPLTDNELSGAGGRSKQDEEVRQQLF